MERLNERKTGGLTTHGLRMWGLFFMAAGIIGRGILQNRLLGVGKLTPMELFAAMDQSEAMMVATAALILQILETCAVPLFAFLLVEGFQRTKDVKNYFIRILGVALVSEIPYNLLMSGKVLDMSSRNPSFGLVLGMLVLFFYSHYDGRSFGHVVAKIVAALAALLWGMMLQLDPNGVCLTLVVCVLWIFRKKELYRNFAGAIATVACCMVSPLFIAAPMGFLVVHFYNGGRGKDADTPHAVRCLTYPLLLLAAFAVGFAL